MPKTILFSMVMELEDKPIEIKDGMKYTCGGTVVASPVVTMFCDSKEHLVERLTELAEDLWDTADRTPIPMKEPS